MMQPSFKAFVGAKMIDKKRSVAKSTSVDIKPEEAMDRRRMRLRKELILRFQGFSLTPGLSTWSGLRARNRGAFLLGRYTNLGWSG